MGIEEFVEALGADVVIPIGPAGRALSISESLALKGWFEERQRRQREEHSIPGWAVGVPLRP